MCRSCEYRFMAKLLAEKFLLVEDGFSVINTNSLRWASERSFPLVRRKKYEWEEARDKEKAKLGSSAILNGEKRKEFTDRRSFRPSKLNETVEASLSSFLSDSSAGCFCRAGFQDASTAQAACQSTKHLALVLICLWINTKEGKRRMHGGEFCFDHASTNRENWIEFYSFRLSRMLEWKRHKSHRHTFKSSSEGTRAPTSQEGSVVFSRML